MKAPTTKIGEELKRGGFENFEKKNYPRFRSAGSQTVHTSQFSKVVLTQQLSKVLLFQKMIFSILKVIFKNSKICHENKIKYSTILYVHKSILFK